MVKTSAGILIYKFVHSKLHVFIVHPGGPFWKDKDEGAWSIPKGEINNEEQLLETAKRELEEETGINPPKEESRYISLGNITQKSGKIVHAWAFEGDWSGLLMCKSYVKLENPPKSGRFITFPEIDKAGFFECEKAKKKLNSAQAELIKRLEEHLSKKEEGNQ